MSTELRKSMAWLPQREQQGAFEFTSTPGLLSIMALLCSYDEIDGITKVAILLPFAHCLHALGSTASNPVLLCWSRDAPQTNRAQDCNIMRCSEVLRAMLTSVDKLLSGG